MNKFITGEKARKDSAELVTVIDSAEYARFKIKANIHISKRNLFLVKKKAQLVSLNLAPAQRINDSNKEIYDWS
jgi:hypothetical protein